MAHNEPITENFVQKYGPGKHSIVWDPFKHSENSWSEGPGIRELDGNFISIESPL